MGYVVPGMAFGAFMVAIGLYYRSLATFAVACVLEILCVVLWYSDRKRRS